MTELAAAHGSGVVSIFPSQRSLRCKSVLDFATECF